MTKQELDKILKAHRKWLQGEDGGQLADLRSADLRGANLYGADLRGANLYCADLYGADLRSADLRSANLYGANLRSADLYYANLYGADLRSADLYCANLYGANLRSAKNVPFLPMVCPEVGSFIGFKKASGHIVELEILSEAKRLSATTRKCRCDKAKVLSIQNLDGTESELREIASNYDRAFIYRVGEIAAVENFDEDRWNECSTGIHFFISRQEAVEY